MQLSALGGDGIGRYGSAQLPDVTVRPDGRLAAIRAYQALLGMQYRPSAAWTIYSYAGIEHANSRHFRAVVDGATLGYGYGSPLYDNRGCLTEGAVACAANTKTVAQLTAGAWWKYYQGALGNLQFGIQGSYTRRKMFEGLGGGPDVNLAVGMVSFRFYPYQR